MWSSSYHPPCLYLDFRNRGTLLQYLVQCLHLMILISVSFWVDFDHRCLSSLSVMFSRFFACLIPLHWIQDSVNFPLLGAGYFRVPLNVLELGSGVQLSYLKAVQPFRSMPARLARQDQSNVHHSPVPRQSLLGPDLAPCGPELLAWLVGTGTILCPS